MAKKVFITDPIKNGEGYAISLDGVMPKVGDTVESIHSGFRYVVTWVGINQFKIKAKDTPAS